MRWVLAVVVAGFALAAVPIATSASGACGAFPRDSTTISLRQGKVNRTALVHVPTGYTAAKPVPLVLNLHGSGSDVDQQRLFTGMSKTANADGFIVVYPQGSIAEGSGFDWNVPGQPLVGGRHVPAGTPDDVAFVNQLVTTLEGSYCIDPKRVYATGFSGGARMTSELGCALSGRIAAIAAVSGLRFPSDCHATRAIPVLAFHGTADPVDPYNGHGQAYWTYSVPEAAKRWAARDGCKSTATVAHTAKTVTLTAYGGCKNRATVELYTIAGEGHEWPGGPTLPPLYTRVLGPQSTAVSANDVMWKFFTAHPLS
ncbi:MAG TPA: PHB depolymerase family esterase [Gaiellaceae bacterium]|nr:PHB depolymerase family esterase [Gaiellaceae bacterium]